MPPWTAADIPPQRGRVFLVTGGSSGLGAEVTLALCAAGAEVILTCRDEERGRAVAAAAQGPVQVRHLDLADLASVRTFAEGLTEPVDVLINNAGVMAVPHSVTADGFERHIGTNHLGPFALTGLLLDRVRDRVVTVTSGLHRLGRVRPDDLHFTRRRYQRWLAYAQSKLANLLFAYELERRFDNAGPPPPDPESRTPGPISLAAHPGVAATEGQRRDTSFQGRLLAGGRAQPPAMGALPLLYAATAADAAGGTCIGPDGLFQRNGHPETVATSVRSHDTKTARRLWEESERATGVRYPTGG
ncbi:oxidoreductase [Streptomyces indicus]|uniref:NAD(P)-dependent dehydrogenase, short-chain alcohol dehydrogenase family n=1 Tax=Streptomyces indicus TaxID=417292 RepID=A0A1G8TGG8_9ACTN|nr:oxidoreductase [Streptomyces indicus]SDJ40646.1 NAD(P)-dependent dehydrogenase, short-chain alcohol dehydrogenase family [Streptomyces indicus]